MYQERKKGGREMVAPFLASVYASLVPTGEGWFREAADRKLEKALGINIITHHWITVNDSKYGNHAWFVCVAVGDLNKTKTILETYLRQIMADSEAGKTRLNQNGWRSSPVNLSVLGTHSMKTIIERSQQMAQDEELPTLLALSADDIKVFYTNGGNSYSVIKPYVDAFQNPGYVT